MLQLYFNCGTINTESKQTGHVILDMSGLVCVVVVLNVNALYTADKLREN
jgi:hypothetical protein